MSSTTKINLTGSTWGHERGYGPLIKLNEERNSIFAASVDWKIRSLKEFGDHSLEDLAQRFDLIVFDHPFTGLIAEKNLLLALDEHIDQAYLDDQRASQIGKAYESYVRDGHIYALPIDVAGHVSARRQDLFEKHGISVPRTWDEILTLAKETKYSKGSLVVIPGFDVDLWCLFVTYCANHGFPPYRNGKQAVAREMGEQALRYIKTLSDLSPSESRSWNPIETLDAMSTRDEFIYTPGLFGYSNYSKAGFRDSLITFGALADGGNGSMGGILGGAGIGISRRCKHPKEAVEVVKVLCSPEIQRGLYVSYGGQPGHRSAWEDAGNNASLNNFFGNTLATLDHSYLRPTFTGFVPVQTHSSAAVWDYVHEKSSLTQTLDRLDEIYAKAFSAAHSS